MHNIYICVYIYICICITYVCIYIYREREREGEACLGTCEEEIRPRARQFDRRKTHQPTITKTEVAEEPQQQTTTNYEVRSEENTTTNDSTDGGCGPSLGNDDYSDDNLNKQLMTYDTAINLMYLIELLYTRINVNGRIC